MKLTFNSADFSVTDQGEGVPVVFLHAGVADKRMWREQIGAVAGAGFRSIAYDRRGFGETVTDNVVFSHMEDLGALLDELSIGGVVLVGCSQGGRIAIDFALAYPDRVAGLVLAATAVSGAPDDEDYPADIQPLVMAYEVAEEAGDIEMLNKVEAHAWLDGPGTQGGRVTGDMRQLFLDMNGIALRHPQLSGEAEPDSAWDAISRIEQPVLLVSGELDFPHIVARHDYLEAEMPNAFATMIADTAHLAPMEKPDLFNRLLVEFLTTLFSAPEE